MCSSYNKSTKKYPSWSFRKQSQVSLPVIYQCSPTSEHLSLLIPYLDVGSPWELVLVSFTTSSDLSLAKVELSICYCDTIGLTRILTAFCPHWQLLVETWAQTPAVRVRSPTRARTVVFISVSWQSVVVWYLAESSLLVWSLLCTIHRLSDWLTGWRHHTTRFQRYSPTILLRG